MQTKTKDEVLQIPDKALHLATDGQFKRGLEREGHTVTDVGRLYVANHKDSGATVAWQPREDCTPHPLGYRAQIVRALVRLGFFVLVLAMSLHFAGAF